MLSGMPDSCSPPPAPVGCPAARAFESAGYRTITDLERASERELSALHGVGPRAIEILRRERGQTRALIAALVAAERHASGGVRPARRRLSPGGRQPRPRAGGPGPCQLLPRRLPRPPAPPAPGHDEASVTCIAAGHGPLSTRRMGDSNPRGLSPNTLFRMLRPWRERSLSWVFLQFSAFRGWLGMRPDAHDLPAIAT